MSEWESRVREHRVWKLMKELGPFIDKAVALEDLDDGARTSLERLRVVLALCGKRIGATDPLTRPAIGRGQAFVKPWVDYAHTIRWGDRRVHPETPSSTKLFAAAIRVFGEPTVRRKRTIDVARGYFVADAVQYTPMDIRCRRGHPGKGRRTHGDPPREIRVKFHGDNSNVLPICI